MRGDGEDGSGGAGDDPVFVLCAGRSGSTLLRFLLDAHPDLACPPETRLPWLARQLATAWTVIEDAGPTRQSANGDSADAAISAPVADGLRRSLDPMMTSYLRRRGKRRYCDKSLGAAQHAGLLLRIWPDARFICLYRHPMDVIASGIEASPWGLTSYGFEPYIGSPPDNNVAALARYWLDYTTSIVAAEERFTDRCLPVRYEDLVTDPDGQIERILEFIGAAPAPGSSPAASDPSISGSAPATTRSGTPAGSPPTRSAGAGRCRPRRYPPRCSPGSTSWPTCSATYQSASAGGPGPSRPTCERGRTT